MRFKLNARLSYQLWLVSLHSVAITLVVFFTNLPVEIRFVLFAALLLSLTWYGQKLKLLPRGLTQKEELDWVLEDQDGNICNASLLPNAYVSPWMIILYFKRGDGRKAPVVILPYMLERDSFRRLAVYLRMTSWQRFTGE